MKVRKRRLKILSNFSEEEIHEMNDAGLLEKKEFKKIKNNFKQASNKNTSLLKGRGGQSNRLINREKQ